jgi:hypothetical protein
MKFGSKTLAVVFAITSAAMFANAQNIPSIIVQPSSQATAPSGTISFTVSASGAGTLAYQWAKNTTNLANGAFSGRATVSGATTSTLTLTTITTNDQANYTCRITNTFGSVTSSIASLTVYVAPTITTQPIGYTNIVGSNYTFTVVAAGSSPLTYQWQYNSSNIPSATLNVFTINNTGTNNSGSYTVSASNPAGTVNSSTANLLILAPPVITIQPANATTVLSNSATFSITAAGSLLHYQWLQHGSAINGATNSSYTITNAPYSANGNTYSVIVTNLIQGFNSPIRILGAVTSAAATLSVVGMPVITAQPSNQTAGVGSNVTFSVGYTLGATPPPFYFQWFENNNAITNHNAPGYALQDVQLSDSGSSYYVVITNSYGSVTSSVANLTVQQYAPAITTQPIGGNVPVGSNFTFTVSATGTTLAYQWQNENGIIAGANANSLTISNLTTSNPTNYIVIITNPVDSVTSSIAVLNVGYPPAIVQQPVSVTTNFSGTASFSCIVTGTPSIILQWLNNGTALVGQTNTTLTLSNILTPIATIQLTATNYFGGIVSSNVSVNLIYPNGYPSNFYQGLVAYYPFNGNANDMSGNGNNLINNGATFGADMFGNSNSAAVFNAGSSTPPQGNFDNSFGGEWMSFGNANPIDGLSAITVSMWLEPGSLLPPAYANAASARILYQEVVLGIGTQGNTPQGVGFGIGNGGSWYSSSLFITNGMFGFTNGAWIHCVYTADATGQNLYANGELVLSNASGITQVGANGYTLGLGAYYNGSIKNLRIYNRVLSSNEVSQLYALESGSTPPQNLTVSPIQDSAFQLQFFGTPNYSYILQATTNLTPPINWQPITTNAADSFGNWIFQDTNSFQSRFYRALAPAP